MKTTNELIEIATRLKQVDFMIDFNGINPSSKKYRNNLILEREMVRETLKNLSDRIIKIAYNHETETNSTRFPNQ